MKKIIILLLIGLSMGIYSCKDEEKIDPDPIPVPVPVPDPTPVKKDYKMPILIKNKAELKAELMKLGEVNRERKGKTTVYTVNPNKSETNMFAKMVYTLTYDKFTPTEFTFTYILNKDVKDVDKAKLDKYLMETTVK